MFSRYPIFPGTSRDIFRHKYHTRQWVTAHSAKIQLKYLASHHDCSIICHVSWIKKNLRLSHCSLSNYHSRLWSTVCISNPHFALGYASIITKDLEPSSWYDEFQMTSSSPALISVFTRFREANNLDFCWPGFGYSALCGRALYSVLRPGLL